MMRLNCQCLTKVLLLLIEVRLVHCRIIWQEVLSIKDLILLYKQDIDNLNKISLKGGESSEGVQKS